MKKSPLNSRPLHSSILGLFLCACLPSCSDEEKSTYLDPPAYRTLHTKDTHGAVFQINAEGDFYLACSIHQGGAAPGRQLFRADQEAPITITKRMHLQRDLHLWTYDRTTLPDGDALNYRPDVQLVTGDRIYILNRGEKIAATIMALPTDGQFRHTYKTDQPFPAGGMSGSPIFLPRTGSVIGVLQTANHKTAATFGGFEQLDIP